MKSVICLLCTCILCSCALLERKVVVDRKASSSALALTETEKIKKLTQYSRTDSSYIETSIELFPKGKFNYSLGKGFEGEASRILVNEKTANVVHERKEKQMDKNRELAVRQQAKEEHTAKQVVAKPVSFLWLGIIVLGIVLVVYAYYKLKFKSFIINSFKKKDYGNYK